MNPDENGIGLSRRKLLAGLGAVGIASAGAGLGTTAYFSDEESFEGNTLTAGEFDLKMDYRMTYNGGHGRLEELQENYPNATFVDENMDPTDEDTGVYLLDQVPDLSSYPDAEDWVHGANSIFNPETGEGDGFRRDDLIDAGELDEALIRIGDVKPGDDGEVTFSTHLYDNPGYMWMGGALTANDQNDYTNPEMDALEEMGLPIDDPDGEGQLADAIEATIWYDDNCDNVRQGGEEGEGADVMLVIDTSGSMGTGTRMQDAINGAKAFVDNLDASSDDYAGLVEFSTNASLVSGLTQNFSDLKSDIDGLSPQNRTNMSHGVDLARDELNASPRAGPKVIVFLGDGEANETNRGGDPTQDAIDAAQDAKDEGTDVYTIGLQVSGTAQSTLTQMASEFSGVAQYYDSPTGSELAGIYSQISQVIQGETIIAEGTLAEVMAQLEVGIPLDANVLEGERVCYTNSVTRCFGFEWELPADVGNEVQTDSVEFAIGFAAEQCRHNDGETNPFAPEVVNDDVGNDSDVNGTAL